MLSGGSDITRSSSLAVGLIGTLLTLSAAAAGPLGQTFTYQGRLLESGAPAEGSYTLVFKLFDDPSAGSQVGSSITIENVPVANGLFTVALNSGGEFGASAFKGDARWLEISVNGTKLTPRQSLTVALYSIYALNAWQLGGNAGADASKNFLGTTDDVPLKLRVNNLRALRFARWALGNIVARAAESVT